MSNQEIKNFENKEEFMKYYEEHKEELDQLQTKELNKQFKINECKISRNKNKIVVRANTPKNKKEPKKKEQPKTKEVKTTELSKYSQPQDLNKVIDHLINEFEKQLSELKELKNKIVSNDLFESENPHANARQEQDE